MVNRTPQKSSNEYSLSIDSTSKLPSSSTSSSSSSTSTSSNLDINNHLKKTTSNLNSLASVAQVLLKHEKSSYSLSNLSAAASAEFMLNYGANTNKTFNDIQQHNANDNIDHQLDDTLDHDAKNNHDKNANNKFKKPSQRSQQRANSKEMKTLISTKTSNFSNGHYEEKSNSSKDINFKFNVLHQQDQVNQQISSSSLANTNINAPNGQIQFCADCGKTFTNKSALAKHRLIHSNERKYTCHLCDKSFKRQDHLNGHLLTHQDKKPFECKAPGCDKSYCDSRSLKRHVEGQHQDYLASLVNGNTEALNYLPSIGKIKANLAPNLQHEINVNELVEASANNSLNPNASFSLISQTNSKTNMMGQETDLNNNNNGLISLNDDSLNGQKPKNFFTFEEPKPETCKICGKGFKNIPALNGHMRLHGGFIKTKLNLKGSLANNGNESNSDLMGQHNEDSMSSNGSSNNSFSSTLSNVSNIYNETCGNNIELIQTQTQHQHHQQLQQQNMRPVKTKTKKTIFEQLAHKNLIQKNNSFVDSTENNNNTNSLCFNGNINSNMLDDANVSNNSYLKNIKMEVKEHIDNLRNNEQNTENFFTKFTQHTSGNPSCNLENSLINLNNNFSNNNTSQTNDFNSDHFGNLNYITNNLHHLQHLHQQQQHHLNSQSYFDNLNYFSNTKKSPKMSNSANTNTNNSNTKNIYKQSSFSNFQSVQTENDSDPNSKFISNILQQKHKDQYHPNNSSNNSQNQHLINGNNISKLSLGSNMAPINGMIATTSNVSSSQMKSSNIFNSLQQQDQNHAHYTNLASSCNGNSQSKNSNKVNAVVTNSNMSKQQKYSSLSSDNSFNENNIPSNGNYSANSKISKNELNQLVDGNNHGNSSNENPYGLNVNSRHDSEKSFQPNFSSSFEETNNYDLPQKQSKTSNQQQNIVQSALTGSSSSACSTASSSCFSFQSSCSNTTPSNLNPVTNMSSNLTGHEQVVVAKKNNESQSTFNQTLNDSLQNALKNSKEKDYQNSFKKLEQSNEIENTNTAATNVLLTKQIVDAINKAVLQVNQANLSSSNNCTSAFKPPNNTNGNSYVNISNMMPPSHVPSSSTGQVNNFSNESNNSINNSNKTVNKLKNKPLPLVIPSDINSFDFQQQQQQQHQNFHNFQYNQSQHNNFPHHIPYYHQMSANPSTSSSHVYPHATLLKSPRLLQNDLKKQYTPPPMLSPFRKGPGLYYKYFANMFLMPNPSILNNQFQFNQFQPNQHNQNLNSNNIRMPLFNHSMSCSYLYPQSNFYNYQTGSHKEPEPNEANFINNESEEAHLDHNNNIINMPEIVDSNFKENIDIDRKKKQLDPINKSKTLDKDDEISINNLKEQILVDSVDNNLNSINSKQSLKRPRLMSQVSQLSNHSNGTFFPEESISANETIAAALIDCADVNTKPFVNIGADYQATLPKLRKLDESSKATYRLKEDLMWSHETITKVSSNQLTNYLKLVCKSSLVYGSSNNLELGLHVLNYFNGDTNKAIKAFFNDSIELPLNHPITTYKYSETDVWTPNEIKMFENALLKNDKVFSEISNEIGKKSTKQCIEFYYLWKKVMSDNVRKKWRLLKKNRFADANASEQNLRSRTVPTNTTTNKNNEKTSNNQHVDNEINSIDKKSQIILERQTSSSPDHNEDNNLNDSKDCDISKNEIFNQRLSNALSPPLLNSNNSLNKRYDCDKCNLVFKTKKKLRYHTSTKH